MKRIDYQAVPPWVSHIVVPTFNLLIALIIAGIVISLNGDDPFEALQLLIVGAFGNAEFIGFTLYFTTNFIFTGLAVAIAFHCGLFNIGGEGQAYIGGLGAGLVALAFGHWPAPVVAVAVVLASALFGASWPLFPDIFKLSVVVTSL